MGFETGQATFVRLKHKRIALTEALRKSFWEHIKFRSFQPIPAGSHRTATTGWCYPDNPYRTEITEDQVFRGWGYALGMRTDTYRVPKKMLEEKLLERAKKHFGDDFSTSWKKKLGKTDLNLWKEELTTELRVAGEVLPSTRVVNVAINFNEGYTYVFSHSETAISSFVQMFALTFLGEGRGEEDLPVPDAWRRAASSIEAGLRGAPDDIRALLLDRYTEAGGGGHGAGEGGSLSSVAVQGALSLFLRELCLAEPIEFDDPLSSSNKMYISSGNRLTLSYRNGEDVTSYSFQGPNIWSDENVLDILDKHPTAVTSLDIVIEGADEVRRTATVKLEHGIMLLSRVDPQMDGTITVRLAEFDAFLASLDRAVESFVRKSVNDEESPG